MAMRSSCAFMTALASHVCSSAVRTTGLVSRNRSRVSSQAFMFFSFLCMTGFFQLSCTPLSSGGMHCQHHDGDEIGDHLHQLERKSEALQRNGKRFCCGQHKACGQCSPRSSLSHNLRCNGNEAATGSHVLAEPCDIAE